MRRAPTLLILLLGPAPAIAQDASTDVGAELRRTARLPAADDRARASAVLARKPGVDVGLLIADWVERLDPGFLPVAAIKL